MGLKGSLEDHECFRHGYMGATPPAMLIYNAQPMAAICSTYGFCWIFSQYEISTFLLLLFHFHARVMFPLHSFISTLSFIFYSFFIHFLFYFFNVGNRKKQKTYMLSYHRNKIANVSFYLFFRIFFVSSMAIESLLCSHH